MRNITIVTAAIALLALPTAAFSATRADESVAVRSYFVATQSEAISVPPAVYAAYIGSCLNAGARTPSLDASKRDAVYVCLVRPRVVAEMERLNFITSTNPRTIGYRASGR
jgi:hypothetical protein